MEAIDLEEEIGPMPLTRPVLVCAPCGPSALPSPTCARCGRLIQATWESECQGCHGLFHLSCWVQHRRHGECPRPEPNAEAAAESASEKTDPVEEPEPAEAPEPELCAVCGDTPMCPPHEDIAICPILTEWSGEIPAGHHVGIAHRNRGAQIGNDPALPPGSLDQLHSSLV